MRQSADRVQQTVEPNVPTPPDVYQLMAAAQMHREGRLIKESAPPIDESQNHGSIAKLFGAQDPPIHAVDDKHYPNDTDAEIGRNVDQTYGDKVAPFLQPGSRAHKLGVDEAIAADSSAGGIAVETAHNVATSMEDRANILKNWQAAQKSPVAAFGFDPRVTIHTPDEGRKLTLAGSYTPSNDTLWYHEGTQDAVVHEAMHRGIELLRKADALPESFKDYVKTHRNGEEYVVRAMKVKYFGDIEKQPDADVGNRQVEEAKWRMANPNYQGEKSWGNFNDMITDLEQAASSAIAKHKPRGPR